MSNQNKHKAEIDSILRTPKAKTKLGLKIPKIPLPHDDLIQAEKLDVVKPAFAPLKPTETIQDSLPSQSSHTRQTRHTTPTRQTSQSSHTSQTNQKLLFEEKPLFTKTEIAPSKNFQKVPNSITRQAIPEGLFKGKDKHLYDVLYSLTRGAIEPKRKVRISKSKLMKLAAIGSRITFDSCVGRLEITGLLKLNIFTGEHEGNEFEILLPEEISSLTSQSSQSSLTSHAQKLDRLVTLVSSQTSQSPEAVNTDISEMSKTYLKTNTNDDDNARVSEAFSAMVKRLDDAAGKISGKPTTKWESEKWKALADLLVLELETAALRTEKISCVPAFLTEVLRRQFFASKQSGFNSQKLSTKNKPDTVGKSDSSKTESYEIEGMDEEGREQALEQLREFAGEEFLKDFQKWYTAADWQWLSERLNPPSGDVTPGGGGENSDGVQG